MKNLFLSKRLISIYYYLMYIVFIIGLIAISYLLIIGKKTEVTFFGDQTDLSLLTSFENLSVIALIGSLYLLYFIVIRLVKNTVDLLAKRSYFINTIISNFKKIGQYFVLIGITASIFKIVITLIVQSTVELKIEGGMLVFFSLDSSLCF